MCLFTWEHLLEAKYKVFHFIHRSCIIKVNINHSTRQLWVPFPWNVFHTAWVFPLLKAVIFFLKPSVLTLFIGQVCGDFSMPLWAGGIGLLLWMSVGCRSIHISSSCITYKTSCSHYAAFSDVFSGSWISWVVLLCDADTTLWHSLHMSSSS